MNARHEYRVTDEARGVLRRLDAVLGAETHGEDEACDCPPFPVIAGKVREAFDADALLVIGGPSQLAVATDLDPWTLARALRAIADHLDTAAGGTS